MSLDAMKLALEALQTNNKAWKQLADSGDAGFWKAEEQPFYETSVKAITALRAAIEQAQEPVAWRDHVEQRLLTWRQRFVNKSGDQLALDDFMDKRSLDDLIDFVCDEYTAPRQWQGLTQREIDELWDLHHDDYGNALSATGYERAIEAKLKEKNT